MHPPQHKKKRHGAVAVVVDGGKFLIIRRSKTVRAPNLLCFPGGSIEEGESPEIAVIRELKEEVGLTSDHVQHLWHSCTSWGTLLEWLWVEPPVEMELQPNPSEVAEVLWLTPDDLLDRPDLLGSVPDFFAAWAHGLFKLPEIAGKPDAQWKKRA